MNSILELDNRYCSGCGVCSAVCPTGAVTMRFDEGGFYSPKVDENKCVSCGKCQSVCGKRNDFSDCRKVQEGSLCAARHKDKNIIAQCSSGGVAWALAQWAIADGRSVVGCVYDAETGTAKHVIADTLEQCEGFKGSKYIQSVTEDCFKQVVKLCREKKGARLMIFGLPCQLYGLMSALEGTDSDIVAVELFCHGVPTQTLWERYLDFVGIKNVEEVSFRSKRTGWHNLSMYIRGDGREHLRSRRGRDMFYRAFLDINTYRDSCISCPLRKFYSKADIRLGDFWGKRYAGDDEGVSAVLTLTQKGENVIKSLPDAEITERVPLSEYVFTSFEKLEDDIDTKARDTALRLLKEGKSLKAVLSGVNKTYPLKKRYIQLRLDLSAKIKKTV